MTSSVPVISAVRCAPITLHAHPELTVHGSSGTHERSDFLLVRVTVQCPDRSEFHGYGEVSATPIWSGEDSTTAEHLVRAVLTPALLGQPIAPVGGLEERMQRALNANAFTRSGIAIALWDCWARWLGVPLATALGGPYRAEVPVKMSLSGDGPVLAASFRAARAVGCRAFKVKVGFDLRTDIRRVAAARELVGPDTFLGVDANCGWSRADAARAVRLLEPYDIAFIEQPCAAGDLSGMREVRRLGATVVADESVFDLADLTRLIAAEAADVVSVYVGKAGGPGRAVELARTADAFGLRTLIGSNGELGIGAAAQIHVACAVPHLALDLPSDIIGANYYTEDILVEPLDNDGVRARLPDGPGLGVALQPHLLARFT